MAIIIIISVASSWPKNAQEIFSMSFFNSCLFSANLLHSPYALILVHSLISYDHILLCLPSSVLPSKMFTKNSPLDPRITWLCSSPFQFNLSRKSSCSTNSQKFSSYYIICNVWVHGPGFTGINEGWKDIDIKKKKKKCL